MRRRATQKRSLVPIQRQGQPPQQKTADWSWDLHLEGYVTKSAKIFECDCGNTLPVPSHSMCKCGRLWNSYVIGTSGGEGREASIEKIVCREVPVRENVIVANKQNPLDRLYQESLGAMKSSNYNRTIGDRRSRVTQVDKLYHEAVKNIQSARLNEERFGPGSQSSHGFVTNEPWGEQAWESQEEYDKYLRSQGITDHDKWKSEWGMGAG